MNLLNGAPQLASLCTRSLILSAALLALAGCGEGDDFSTVAPRIEVTPAVGTPLVFEEVVIGRTQVDKLSIRVRNVGDGILDINDIRIDGPGADNFSVSSGPTRLAPGNDGLVFIGFNPSVFGRHEAVLHIESNDTELPDATLPLVGPARDPCSLEMGPPHQDLLLSEVREVTLQNTSNYHCDITGLSLDRSLFDFENGEPELPFRVEAGQNYVFRIQHINYTSGPVPPVRQFIVRELEGTEVFVTLGGEPPVFDCIDVFPPNVSFPKTEIDATAVRSVTVTNTCNKEAVISSVAMANGYFYYSVPDQEVYPFVLPPRGNKEISIVYSPLNPQGDHGRLVIGTNDGNNPRFEVDLFGQAAVPRIDAFPTVLDFGTVVFKNPNGIDGRSECASRQELVQIESTGDAPLTISNIEIADDADGFFQITSVIAAGMPVVDFSQPISVPVGENVLIGLQFAPTREMPAAHASSLVVTHNGRPTEGGVLNQGITPFEVQLFGDGTGDGAATDTFQQLEGPKVDILWVIDNSCSMYDEQARLISNLSQFVGYADSVNADYQMAVTVTDARSARAGRLERCFPHPAVVSSIYPDREEAFRCMFDVGVNGGGVEAGLGAAKRALERIQEEQRLPGPPTPTASFLRDDAKLALVMMSDEDDQSDQSNAVLRDFFWSVKGSHRPDRVAVHAIAGPVEEECFSGIRNARPGYRYSTLTRETGGLFFNICNEDWQPLLRGLGVDVFTPTDEWDLSQAADPGSIVVTVDGIAVPFSNTNGYVYNPIGNSVKFHGASVPTPGQQIQVSYTGLCRP